MLHNTTIFHSSVRVGDEIGIGYYQGRIVERVVNDKGMTILYFTDGTSVLRKSTTRILVYRVW